MKKTFTLLFTIIAIFSFSQPVFQYSAVTTGFSGTVFIAPKPTSPGPSGANVTWNFSSLSFTPVATASVLPASSTPYASSFPAANWAAVITTTANMYVYYNVQPNSYDQLGNNITAVGGQTYTPDPKRHLIFPFNYGNSYSDTYQCISCAPGSFTVTYDAYGTLILNGKTYNNVARVSNLFGFPYWNYYNTNPLYSIFSYDSSPSGGSTASYIEVAGMAASVEENIVVKNMKVFPNPANNNVTIQNDNFLKVSFSIMDVLGKEITPLQQLSQGEKTKVDLSTQQAGIYFIHYLDEFGNNTYSKLIIE